MDPLNQNQLNKNRPILFIVFISVLALLGIVAGVNLIYSSVQELPQQSSSQLSQQPNQVTSGHVIANDDGSKMVVQDSFVKNTSNLNYDSNSSNIQTPKPDALTAAAYLVGNVKTGKIYLSSDIDKVLPVASMSKLMTAIVATNKFTSTTTIEITPADMSVATDTSLIGAGEKFSLKEILYPLLLNSSNIAAEAIASTYVGTSTSTSTSIFTSRLAFLSDMSSTAWEIGMPTTYFADPSGLDEHNQASANDIFVLAQYLYSSRPDILAITRVAHYSVATTTDHGAHSFDSIHPFVNDSRFIGGKTGRTTSAGETMLTMLNISGQPIAFIVLHSDFGARALDTNLLIKKYLELGI